jgi:hypothetical protein
VAEEVAQVVEDLVVDDELRNLDEGELALFDKYGVSKAVDHSAILGRKTFCHQLTNIYHTKKRNSSI